jgi:hypothetical protein
MMRLHKQFLEQQDDLEVGLLDRYSRKYSSSNDTANGILFTNEWHP